jgi:hypothetical protein
MPSGFVSEPRVSIELLPLSPFPYVGDTRQAGETILRNIV